VMRRISEVISELEAYQAQHGDVYLVGDYRGQMKTFAIGSVKSRSLTQPMAVIPLGEIRPGTQDWRDYCTEANK